MKQSLLLPYLSFTILCLVGGFLNLLIPYDTTGLELDHNQEEADEEQQQKANFSAEQKT